MNTIASSATTAPAITPGLVLAVYASAFGSGMSNTPSVRLDYTRIKEDAYRETGYGIAG